MQEMNQHQIWKLLNEFYQPIPIHQKNNRITLGNGTFGKIILAKHRYSHKLYAIKMVISSHQISEGNRFIQQLRIHSKMKHPNIIKVQNHFYDKQNLIIIMQYASNGNLFQYLRKKMDKAEIPSIFEKICNAVSYLHNNGIIHRDIKPQNILISEHFQPKICDFGWSTNSDKERATFCGTYQYMAPQLLIGEKYNYKVDIWALGILLYQLNHKKAPFQGKNIQQILYNLNKGILFNKTIELQKVNYEDVKNKSRGKTQY